MAVETTSLLVICQEIAKELGAYESGTLTSIATTKLTCTDYPFKTQRVGASDRRFEGNELYLTDGQFTPLAIGIAAYDASAGEFTPSLDWTDGGTDPTTFDIYLQGLRIATLKDAVNRALRKMYYEQVTPLTLITDGDMETSGTSSWTDSSASSSKVTAAVNVHTGNQALFVDNSGADGYSQSVSVPTIPSAGYILQARVSAVSGTAELVAYDVTNGAEITTETYEGRSWGTVNFGFVAPSDCRQIAVRLQGQEATAAISWDDVTLLRNGAGEVSLPDYILRSSQLRHVTYGDWGDDRGDRDIKYEFDWWHLVPDMLSANHRYKVQFSPHVSRPIWIQVSRHFAALSADTDTTSCPREWIIKAGLVETASIMRRSGGGTDRSYWQIIYRDERRKLKGLNSRYMPSATLHYDFESPY